MTLNPNELMHSPWLGSTNPETDYKELIDFIALLSLEDEVLEKLHVVQETITGEDVYQVRLDEITDEVYQVSILVNREKIDSEGKYLSILDELQLKHNMKMEFVLTVLSVLGDLVAKISGYEESNLKEYSNEFVLFNHQDVLDKLNRLHVSFIHDLVV